jgi:hypothetical protein
LVSTVSGLTKELEASQQSQAKESAAHKADMAKMRGELLVEFKGVLREQEADLTERFSDALQVQTANIARLERHLISAGNLNLESGATEEEEDMFASDDEDQGFETEAGYTQQQQQEQFLVTG